VGDPSKGFDNSGSSRAQAGKKASADFLPDENLLARTGRTAPKAASWNNKDVRCRASGCRLDAQGVIHYKDGRSDELDETATELREEKDEKRPSRPLHVSTEIRSSTRATYSTEGESHDSVLDLGLGTHPTFSDR